MVRWQVRLLTAPPGSMPQGGAPRRPPLLDRLRLREGDCQDPVPTQLLQKCAR